MLLSFVTEARIRKYRVLTEFVITEPGIAYIGRSGTYIPAGMGSRAFFYDDFIYSVVFNICAWTLWSGDINY